MRKCFTVLGPQVICSAVWPATRSSDGARRDRRWLAGGDHDEVIAIVGAIGEGQDALARPGRWARRGACGQAEVGEDLVGDEGILDAGDELHATVAAWAVEHVKAPGSGHQPGPLR